MILIADLSNNQVDVSVGVVARVCQGLYHKASEGTSFTDGFFNRRRADAAAHRLPFGAYHFAHPSNDPIREALHFCNVIKVVHPSDLRPVLDLESGDSTHAETWARRFNGVVHERFGVWPLFYSYPDYIARMRAATPIGGGLWLASYSRNDGKDHPYFVPKPWSKALLHQFTSVGTLAGVPMRVDLSHAAHLPPLLAGTIAL